MLNRTYVFVARTPDELSLLCPVTYKVESDRKEQGWCGLKVAGSLAFEMVGVLAGLSRCLAEQGISIFAISTFDTDYLFVKSADLPNACQALVAAGYGVTDIPEPASIPAPHDTSEG